jgi:hypothetical protein
MKFSIALTLSTLAFGVMAAPAKGNKVKQLVEGTESTVEGVATNVPSLGGLMDLSEFSEQAKPLAKIMKNLLVEVKSETGGLSM